MRAPLVILATLLVFAGPSEALRAQTKGTLAMAAVKAAQAAQTAIQALIVQEDAAWNAGDAIAFSARTTPDVVFTNIVGMFSVGRGPFEAQHAKIFSTIYKDSRLKQTMVHLAFVRPDVAILDTLAELTGFSHLPPGAEAADGVLRTRLEQVVVRQDGEWWVAAFHNVAIHPSVR